MLVDEKITYFEGDTLTVFADNYIKIAYRGYDLAVGSLSTGFDPTSHFIPINIFKDGKSVRYMHAPLRLSIQQALEHGKK